MIKPIYNFFIRRYHSHYHEIYEHAKKLFIFDIFLLIVALSIFASTIFFFFWTPGLTDQIDLKISLGNDHIKSGESVKLSINYKNRSKYYLRESILAVHLPNGFVVDRELTPISIFRNDSTFDLKDLRPGANGTVEIYGRLWTNPKEDDKIIALLSYLPENSNSKEQKLGAFLLNLQNSVLGSSLEITESSFANARVPFVYKLVNTSDQKLDGLKFDIEFADKPVIMKETQLQDIILEKNGERLITGDITIPAKPGRYNLIISTSAKINNQQIKILTKTATLEIYSPNVSISTNLKENLKFAEPDQIINATVAWKNSGQFELQKSNLRLSFNPGVVDIKKTALENNFKIDGQDIIVSSLQRTALASIQTGDNDEFQYKIILLPTFNLAGAENANLEIKTTFEGELKNKPGQKFFISAQPIKIPLTTEVKLNAQARYYSNEGDQLGRGPLPPKVKETTKYWIFININNTSNPIRETSFFAVLPNGVNFTGKQSVSIGPSLEFNPSNRTIQWNYRELPPNSQTGLYFEVAVIPNSDQIGKNIDLVSEIKFNATDKNTEKQFNLSQSIVNNTLPIIDLGNKKSSLVK
jgi:hypothetical protein